MAFVTGLILAGGQGRRVGGEDKGLLRYQGAALIDHAISRLRPQVAHLMISANRSLSHYAQRGIFLVEDRSPGFLGPMAGIATGLSHCETDWMQVVPCDGPHFPLDLVARLRSASHGASRLVVPVTKEPDGREARHDIFMLVHRSLAASAAEYLLAGGRRLRDWAEAQRPVYCSFEDGDAAMAFCNLNTREAINDTVGRRASPS